MRSHNSAAGKFSPFNYRTLSLITNGRDRVDASVAKKAVDDRTRGGEKGGFESGLLKMGIEGGGSLMT